MNKTSGKVVYQSLLTTLHHKSLITQQKPQTTAVAVIRQQLLKKVSVRIKYYEMFSDIPARFNMYQIHLSNFPKLHFYATEDQLSKWLQPGLIAVIHPQNTALKNKATSTFEFYLLINRKNRPQTKYTAWWERILSAGRGTQAIKAIGDGSLTPQRSWYTTTNAPDYSSCYFPEPASANSPNYSHFCGILPTEVGFLTS